MLSRVFISAFMALGLVACAETTSSVPAVPDSGPVPGAQIRSLVEGGPYDVRVFAGRDAGTSGRGVIWDFDAGTVSGNYLTEEGETGTFSLAAEVVGDRLCAGNADNRACHQIYAYQDGFMEVRDDGVVHAVSTPAD